MALLYILLGIGLIVINVDKVPAVFAAIFQGAFRPAAVTGGIVGSFFVSMQKGVSRGIFSNEAGLGTGSIAHACADTENPVQQGMFGIFEVFMDTIVICTMTALIILLSGVNLNEPHLAALCDLFHSLHHCEGIELLPYHTYGDSKNTQLGRPSAAHPEWIPTEAQLAFAREYINKHAVLIRG
jgi:Na+/alanine symporter